jgi:IS30 family transposase
MSPLTPARRPWTVDEQKKLDDLMEAGKTAAEIATALQRTPPSIYSRLQRLYRKQPKPGRRLVDLGLKVKGK